ncbi:MAG: hypothetical protein ACLPUO_25865, partial [Streptosporangiaceae bacterium]
MRGSQCQSATCDLAVGRLDDLGGFPNCLVPHSGVRAGEGSFGGVEPGGDRGPPGLEAESGYSSSARPLSTRHSVTA